MNSAAVARVGDGMRHGVTRHVPRPVVWRARIKAAATGRDEASGGDGGRHAGQDKQGHTARSPAARRNPVQRRASRIQGNLMSARTLLRRRGAGRGAATFRRYAAWAARNVSAAAVHSQRPRAVLTTGRHRGQHHTPAALDPSRPIALATLP